VSDSWNKGRVFSSRRRRKICVACNQNSSVFITLSFTPSCLPVSSRQMNNIICYPLPSTRGSAGHSHNTLPVDYNCFLACLSISLHVRSCSSPIHTTSRPSVGVSSVGPRLLGWISVSTLVSGIERNENNNLTERANRSIREVAEETVIGCGVGCLMHSHSRPLTTWVVEIICLQRRYFDVCRFV